MADGVPRFGVTSVGEVANTKAPVPVAPVEVTPSINTCPALDMLNFDEVAT